jgi:hypothetical protein
VSERADTSRGLPTARTVSPLALRYDTAIQIAVWVAIALPAIWQLGLLATTIGGRMTYPYDLEWMEGGMLHHAQRIHDGVGIYVPPSLDFIPYLYTPLYPSLIALFGVSYTTGRVISVLSLIGIAITAVLLITSKRHHHVRRGPAWAGTALGLGLFAAAYPISDGWYDLVRADTLFLMLVTIGIGTLPRWCEMGTGIAGHAQIAAPALLLTLAFFCKQTGIIYVALGGCIVLVLAWRRLAVYVAVAGLFGLGGTYVLQQTSEGWFWTYVSEIHRAHDFNWDRFGNSFINILWRTTDGGRQFPLIGAPITTVVVVSLVFVLITRIHHKTLPRQVRPLLLWASVFGVSTIVGAVGWGTEFAHFNAYMPAQLHGALAAGSAIPAVYACTHLWWGDRPRRELGATGCAAIVALPLAITCITATWSPSKFTPTPADEAAGDKLIAHIRELPGEVWMPSHPWYLELAGKTPRVHRMGIRDVTWRQSRTVAGVEESLTTRGFSAIILDNADLHNRDSFPALHSNYRIGQRIPDDERPRVYTGARVIPDEIWVPIVHQKPPAGARVVFDFETPAWGSWNRSGVAWGNGPADRALPGQGIVHGVDGRRYANSMHDGDASTGRVTSPKFKLDAAKLTVRIGGGTDTTKLRVEAYVADAKAPWYVVSVDPPGGDTLQQKTIPIPDDKRDKQGYLVLVDDSKTDHLVVDDVWAWR